MERELKNKSKSDMLVCHLKSISRMSVFSFKYLQEICPYFNHKHDLSSLKSLKYFLGLNIFKQNDLNISTFSFKKVKNSTFEARRYQEKIEADSR